MSLKVAAKLVGLARRAAHSFNFDTRAFPPSGAVSWVDQNAVDSCPRSVGQNGRTNDRPVEAAPADDTLLQVFVGIDTPEE